LIPAYRKASRVAAKKQEMRKVGEGLQADKAIDVEEGKMTS